MAIVRTINGDVAPETLGVVNAHDHLIRVGAGEVYIDPDHLLDDVDKAATEAGYFVEASKRWADGGTIIDMCPASSGRGVLKTLQVVEKTPGLQVVQATGFHQQKVYLEWRQSWVNQYSITQIADLLIADIVEGIDRFDYMGPIVERTEVKAGVIKWATAYGKITEWEQKAGKAVAIASKETGAPINTHVTAGTCGPEQARFLVAQGVAPEKIAIGHIQRNWDPWVQEQIVKLGCYVELDGTNRIKYVPDNCRVNLLKVLGEKGYGAQILLGTDSGKASYQKVYGSVSGIDYDPAVFAPRLVEDEGFDPEYVQDLLVRNAARFFAFDPIKG
ncbi:phosphotriesterase family protein [Acidipropionibacterium timonense]|uniref:phosphotriesterase family protein n=1 Tax=Acidipropionibacterium timonense TaxID=2161818 RepID=UPI00102FE6B6|nr:phosphotriesterase-related protein [Acidipropionibacterium timonense]